MAVFDNVSTQQLVVTLRDTGMASTRANAARELKTRVAKLEADLAAATVEAAAAVDLRKQLAAAKADLEAAEKPPAKAAKKG